MLSNSLFIKACSRRVANLTSRSSFNTAHRALAIPAVNAHNTAAPKKSIFSSNPTRTFHSQRPSFLPSDAIYGDQGIFVNPSYSKNKRKISNNFFLFFFSAQQMKKSSSVYHRSSTSYMWTPREVLKALDVPTPNFPHKDPKSLSDNVAFQMVRLLRVVSDMYFKTNYLLRACMLETVAAVPGMVAGIRQVLNFWDDTINSICTQVTNRGH